MARVLALTREVSPALSRCQLTHLARHPIDVALARTQHRQYELALEVLGCDVRRLPGGDEMPDSVFVEDTAVVLPELAIITRPGAESRRSEVTSVAEALRPHHSLAFIESPGTLDGGDVLTIGSAIYVGESTRTNAEGIRQLAELASQFGYRVRPMRVSGCLHLKSAVTRVAEDVILVNSAWVDSSLFPDLRQIEVDRSEPFAANALLIGDSVIYSASYDQTRQRLEKNGLNVH